MPRTGRNIYKRKDGRYEGRILVGKKEGKKPRYIYVYAKTYHEVRQKMKLVQEQNVTQKRAETPLLKVCAEEWLADRRALWKQTTYDMYCRTIRLHILPALGDKRIGELDKDVLKKFADTMAEKENGGLSPHYQKYICSLVRQITLYAVQKYQLALPQLQLPDFRISRSEMRLPGEQELEKLERYLLEHLDDDTCLGILLATYTGIRIGELCALRWRDIDLESGMLYVCGNLQRVYNHEEGESKSRTRICNQSPKTMKSMRAIPLADDLLRILKERKKGPDYYLISGKKKEWAEIRTVQYRFSSILKKCGIAEFHFHLLRHAFATRCIRRGCDIKTVSEVLGHSSVQITMNIYAHSSVRQKKDMMNLICSL